MLTVILVVDHRFNVGEPGREQTVLRRSRRMRPVGILPPIEESLAELSRLCPVAGINQCLQPSAIGARLATEDPMPGLEGCLGRTGPVTHHPERIAAHPRRDWVVGLRFIQRPDRAHSPVEQCDLLRKRIAEQARDLQRHIHPRSPESGERDDLIAAQPQ